MLAPLVCQQQGTGTPTKALRIDGLEVLYQNGSTNSYSVDPATITVIESGDSQPGSMSFTLSDPNGQVRLTPGQVVHFMDVTRNVPLFWGFIDSLDATSLGVGRTVQVECVGIGILLDWLIVPSASFPAYPGVVAAADAVQGMIALATGAGAGMIRAARTAITSSTQANPVGMSSAPSAAVSVSGVTLRTAIQAVFTSVGTWMYDTFSVINPGLLPDYRMQIDWYGGLRVWDTSGNWAGYPVDWVGVTLTAHAPTDTSYSVAQGDARSVYVIGGNAAGTALFPDGSGIPGPTAVINDSTILTYGGAFSAAASYFKANGVLASGTVVSDEWDNIGTAGAEAHAGMTVTITDPNIGLSSFSATINEISKTFNNSGTERWSISYGSRLRGSTYLRRLTSTTIK